ncbi:hypothetical protein K1T71_010299 [Dendrolimus kikuchii]|uniref:Uncharacterized protein n=1 Tax=Dendrolimus kikuchii TaxID=765133 RepID=A0ACC1CR49_9NEOP|nr:hypothetical protein K1T71_010299 [Dendrolimus kikuchii]
MVQYAIIVHKEEVMKLVPASSIDDVACFALYDNHPRDQRYVDISVCTKKAEVIEFYQRNKLASITLNCPTTPEEITLFRNSAGRLFYLIFLLTPLAQRPKVGLGLRNENMPLFSIASSLKIKTQVPWVKSCNQKLIIVLNILNEDIVPLKDVNILLRNTSQSLVYSTKLFEKISKPPLWTESPTQKVKPDLETAVIGVINIEQLKNNILSRIEFKGTICCKKEGNDCFLPFNDVTISSLDTMGEDFDVLSSKKFDENDMLAVLSTTEKLDLILKPIINVEGSKALNILETFCTYLDMEMIFSNIIIHRKSPYHILNGLMMVCHDYDDFHNRASYLVSVYARASSQILALLHHIYDRIPFRIIINVANNKNETYSTDEGDNLHPVSKKMSMILEYLDNLMVEKSEIKESMVQNRIPSGSFKNFLAKEDEDQLERVGFDDRKASRRLESMVID